MSRTGRHISRALIALLVLVFSIGGIVYLNKTTPPKILPRAVASTPPTTTPSLAPSVAPTTSPTTEPSEKMGEKMLAATETDAAKVPAESSGDLIAKGIAKKDADDLLGARQLLNEVIQQPNLSDAEMQKCRAALGEINQTLIFSTKRFADDEYGGTYTVQSGQVLAKIADAHNVTWELLCRINGLSDPKKLRAAATIKVVKGPFHAVVTKHSFTIDIYVGAPPGQPGSLFVMSCPVGLGKDDSTPTGVWKVQQKLKDPRYYSPRGEGVIESADPKNPLGHRWIGLAGVDGHAVGKLSYGIHGTIDPDSIGKQSSLGCIRMRNEDVEQIYDLLVEGKSQVVVKD